MTEAIQPVEAPESVQPEPQVGVAIPSRFSHWQSTPVATWRRFAARQLDTIISGTIGFMVFVAGFYIVAPIWAEAFVGMLTGRMGNLIDIILTVFFGCLFNAVSMPFLGNTLGKVIFGIKVLTLSGQNLNLPQNLRREAQVWVMGFGAGLPIISLLTFIGNYRELTDKKSTSWDRNTFQVLYRKPGALQTALNILGVAILIAFRVGLRMAEHL